MRFFARLLVPALLLPMLVGAAGLRTSRTHVVLMQSSRFEPTEPKVSVGDTVRFVNASGGPHNVEFVTDSIAAPARAKLESIMGGEGKLGPLSSPLLIIDDESYSIVVPDVAAGRYAFLCLPHQAFMRGAMVVTR